uniref:SJCHGC02753 protein n=1 Tax=Schistosoma japonicum TaxID=6182 RepID=Q5DDU0_SCHJA|nr:SJCHGC02753 protein [Schistosoma japonicum]
MDVLLSALLRIILLVSSDRQSHFFWVYWCDDDGPTCSKSTTLDVKHTINDTVCSEPLDSNVNQLSECGFQTFISGLRCFEAETVDELRAVAFSLHLKLNRSMEYYVSFIQFIHTWDFSRLLRR